MDMFSFFKNADMFPAEKGAAVRSAHVLVAEFDGMVSHHIVRSEPEPETSSCTPKLNVFESMEDVICALPVRHRGRDMALDSWIGQCDIPLRRGI